MKRIAVGKSEASQKIPPIERDGLLQTLAAFGASIQAAMGWAWQAARSWSKTVTSSQKVASGFRQTLLGSMRRTGGVVGNDWRRECRV